MGRLIVMVLSVCGILACASAVWLWMLMREGARHRPSTVEAQVARALRRLAIPREAREAANPVAASDEVLREGRAHFADHCATCHANDGSGDVPLGRGLYPPAPDMRKSPTQSLTDGEIFFIIHNGIPLTGMPAWGEGDSSEDRDSWELVHFIRHLPKISDQEIAEMERKNPKSAEDREEDDETKSFLEGTRGETHGSAQPGHHH
jgi:mono/diheme cytochrome c family protein